LRALLPEEDLARQLLASLKSTQRLKGIIDGEAPPDILTRAEAHAKVDAPVGLSAAEMTEDQQRTLTDLILIYGNQMPQEVAHRQMEQIRRTGKGTSICLGRTGGGMLLLPPHGPSFLIEYDNTQNDANPSIRCGGTCGTIGAKFSAAPLSETRK
jgi:hypothetical protein